jgi:hypothetical protein
VSFSMGVQILPICSGHGLLTPLWLSSDLLRASKLQTVLTDPSSSTHRLLLLATDDPGEYYIAVCPPFAALSDDAEL